MLGKKASATMRIRIAIVASSLTALLIAGILILQGCQRQDVNTQNNSSLLASKGQLTENSEQVYEYVEKMPEATYNLADYMARNIHYPDVARERKIEGRVAIKFVVDKDGNIVKPLVLSSPDSLLSSAALNVIGNMPKWIPGEKNGRKVDVYMVLPVVFKLDNSLTSTKDDSKQAAKVNQVPSANHALGTKPPFIAKMDKQTGGALEFVDKMPEPTFNLSDYLSKNIHYPKEARDKKIEGRVTVRFVVGVDGKVTDATVMRSPDESLSSAALTVVKNMPDWTPGEKDGKKVAVYYTIPIAFKL